MNNCKTDVTVIVPVYQVENYLEKCLDTIISQTHRNIEIILVDDGSKDNSGVICEQYAKKDGRIKVIHKKNGGLSDARNKGIKIAKGKYILFVDSDDYIKQDAIEILLCYAEKHNLEILSGNAVQVNNNVVTTLYGGVTEDIVDGKKYLIEAINNGKYLAATWLRLYRTDFIINNSLYFKVGLLHEDEQWTPYVFMKAKHVGYINYNFYYYVIRDGSITQKQNREKHIMDVISTCTELVGYFESLNLDERTISILKDYYERLYMNTVTYGKYKRKKYYKVINKNFVLKNSKRLKTKIKSLLYCISEKSYRNIMMIKFYKHGQ